MADNPFFNSNLMALGGQMAQAWQRTLDSWWQGLLGDRDRLRTLAQQLDDAAGREGEGGEALLRELLPIVEALELLEKRQESLEEQVRTLSDNLAAVVSFLEKAHEGGAKED
jgi:hypothetical protein